MELKKYRKRADQFIIAVQISLDTDGMKYTKWGHEQRCEAGDWLVNNKGDCYTISEDSFAKTYTEIMPGLYLKKTPVWARVVDDHDSVSTKEGSTDYTPGDYWVTNNSDGTDSYSVSKIKFEQMYEEA